MSERDVIRTSNTVAFLKARFADESMPWPRPHIESLIEQIDTLTKQRDEGWQAFNNLRKQVGEDRYPGMTSTVRPTHETRPIDWEAEYKKLAGVYTREGLEKFIADYWPGNVLADATGLKASEHA